MSINNSSRRDGDNGQRKRRPRISKPVYSDSREDGRYKRSGYGDAPSARPRRNYDNNEERPRRSYDDNERRPNRGFNNGEERPRRSFNNDEERPRRNYGNGEERPRRNFGGEEGRGNRPQRNYGNRDDRPRRNFNSEEGREDRPRRSYGNEEGGYSRSKFGGRTNGGNRHQGGKPQSRKIKTPPPVEKLSEDGSVRLNKYIAHAGICSRREADNLIAAGSISVNGKVITEMGFKVMPGDVVNYGGETLRSEAKRYFLLNKPKGFITTLDDPQERQTVMMLIDGACKERIYPVGRLDRNTTGLLLFTNDGEMARKLTHPSTGVYKIYHVELNKPVTREDMRQMLEGIELEDGMIRVDDVQYVAAADDKRIVGVELHSGKNRIVRRIFEHLGYDVHKLDRVVFAGLTKKDLPRGRYRELTEKEVGYLKMI